MTGMSGVVRATVAVLAVGGVLGAAATTTRSVELAPPQGRADLPAVADVALTDAALSCPGPERVGATGLRDVKGKVQVAAVTAPAAVLAAVLTPPPSGKGALDLGRVGPGGRSGSTTERGRLVTSSVTSAEPVVARARDALAPGLAAVQSWVRGGDDDRGLAMTPCALPASDLWLVGGDKGASRTERLVLVNPGANTVSVDFTVYGATGTVDGAGKGISISPRSRAVLSLDRLAPDVASPVVHVVASGGQITGVLSDAWIEGATGRGIDDASPSAPPGTDLVVAGVDKAGAAALRIGNPGAVEALVQVRVLTAEGPTQPDKLRVVRVPAGSTAQVPLEVADGAIGLRLLADHPVVAGAWVERRVASGEDRMGDFGWAPATPGVRQLAGTGLGAVTPSGAASRLLVAAGAEAAHVRVTTVTGGSTQEQSLAVEADHAAAVDLGGADQVWMRVESGTAHAAVTVSGTHEAVTVSGTTAQAPYLSVLPLADAPVTALSVPVRQVGS
jgi:hypothetical protein